MRKFYLFVTALWLHLAGLAQGTATVTATNGLEGPTVYYSIATAFDSINAGVHKGQIVVTLSGVITETRETEIAATGSGNANYQSILIRPVPGGQAAVELVVPDAAVFWLNGASNIVIDGSSSPGATSRDLQLINAAAGPYSNGIEMGRANNNIIRNCIIRYSGQSGFILFESGYNLIENNEITRYSLPPRIGILTMGSTARNSTANYFRANQISDFTDEGFFDMGYSSNTLIESNEFFQTFEKSQEMTAIRIGNSGMNVTNLRVTRNRIHNLLTTHNGQYSVNGILVMMANSVTIDNNMIDIENHTAHLFGIYNDAPAGAAVKILFNTIRLKGEVTGNQVSAAIWKSSASSDLIRNNLFINMRVSQGTGRQYAFRKSGTTAMDADYNDYVSDGNVNNILFANGNTPVNSLTQWRAATALDGNSLSIAPIFISESDLKMSPEGNTALDNRGIPVSGFQADFFGNARSPVSPDMGAYEFSSVTPVRRVDADILMVKIYPAVTTGTAVLQVSAKKPDRITWTVFDASGRAVAMFMQAVTTGINTLPVHAASWPAGVYTITGFSGTGSTGSVRLVRQ